MEYLGLAGRQILAQSVLLPLHDLPANDPLGYSNDVTARQSRQSRRMGGNFGEIWTGQLSDRLACDPKHYSP